eukprot:gb/GECG01008835.1/.p1 GENE.gb/GECG01008835.1/~~gb/GECG01008835.1/.p1  ORF type:complete len:277 (+),score=43.51 gb/GECG01008835.1/:1-831(+)
MSARSSEQGKRNQNVIRVALVGNGSVGKSSVCGVIKTITEKNAAKLSSGDRTYSGDGIAGFPKQYKQTLGSDWASTSFTLRGTSVLVEFTDIGGQSLRSKMLPNYLSGTHVVVFCYDVTDRASLQDVEDWIRRVREAIKEADRIQEDFQDVDDTQGRKNNRRLFYLLGNKLDLISNIQVSEQAHSKFVQENELDGGDRVSAKNGDNVVKFFAEIVGEAAGISLTPGELDAFASVVRSSVKLGDEKAEGRTVIADEIEAEDMRLEEERQKRKKCALL